MLADLEARCLQFLSEVVTTSQGITSSAVYHANASNFSVFERLHRQLETIRISAGAIIYAITRASATNYVIDVRLTDWLLSGNLQSCSRKLKEMGSILPSIGQVGSARHPVLPSRASGDNLVAAMVFLDNHYDLFYFLLNPSIWNQERLLHQSSGAVITAETPGVVQTQMTWNGPAISQYQDGESKLVSDSDRAEATRRKKLDEVLRWLAALNCTEKHNSTLKLRQEGTCKWFPNTDTYEKWRTGRNHFLWLHGKAGCGKSVLVASMIEYLKKSLKYEEVVIFFYCDFQNERSTSPTEMMRSILSQMFQYLRDLRIDPKDWPTRILDEKSKGTLSLQDLDKLCSLVSHVANRFRYEPIIVIDALDECADIEVLLHALVKLNDGDVRILVTSRPHEEIVHHFAGLHSLSFEDVAEELAGDIELHVRRELVLLDGLRSAYLWVKDEILATLTRKAWGRFRWVQCQLDTLKQCTTRVDLKEALDHLPNDLEATYERILERIDERKMEGKLARRTLAWLVVALQPLRLVQIIDGLSTDVERQDRATQWLRTALLSSLSSLVSYHKETDLVVLSHFSVKEYLVSSAALALYHVIPHEAHANVAQMCFRYISSFLKQKCVRSNVRLLESSPMLSYVLSSGFNHIAHVEPESSLFLEALESFGSDVRHHPAHWDLLREFREEDLRWPYPPWPSSRHDFVLYILIAYSSPTLFRSYLSANHPLKPRAGANPLVYAADLRETDHAIALLECGADVNMPSLVADGSHKASPLEIAIDLADDMLVGELLKRGCTVPTEVLSTAICMPWCSSRVLVKLLQTREFEEWAKEIGDERLFRGVFNSARPNAGDIRRADEDQVALARRLCQLGQDLSVNSRFGAELMERALHAAHTSLLEYLLPPDQPPPEQLLLAASTGDTSETVSVVRFLLRKGANVNAETRRRDTPLHLAALCPWEPRSLELTEMLIKAGSKHVRNSRGETPLFLALKREHLLVVLSYNVSLPSDVRHFMSDGNTMFHLAIAKYGESLCLDLMKRFVEVGCDLNALNFKGQTAVEVAIEHSYTSVVEYLLSRGISFPFGILLHALQNGHTLPMIDFLIQECANIRAITLNGDTVLHLAITRYGNSLSLDLVKKLVEAGCDPTVCNFEGETVVEVALEHGHSPVVKYLLSCDIPLPSHVLLTALQNRIDPPVIESLVQKGADIHAITSEGDTVLHLAITYYAESPSLDLVTTLTKAGFGSAACNFEGKTIMEVAFKRGYHSVVEHLLSCNILLPSDSLLIALQNGSILPQVESLIQEGANIHSTTPDGETLLHLAITKYDSSLSLNLVKLFIKVGYNITFPNSKDETIFEVAIQRGFTWVTDYILSCGIPFPPRILLDALRNRWALDNIRYLVRSGADLLSTTSDGDTVLHLAVAIYSGLSCLYLVKMFIKAGCHPAARNFRGETIYEVAIKYHPSVTEHLLQCDLPPPPDILPIALRNHTTPVTIELLIQKGANVHSTSDGDTVLHLIVANYSETQCLRLLMLSVDAGCDPMAQNSRAETILQVAMKRGFISVTEHLLSIHVPPPPAFNILSMALQQRCTPRMIQSLVHKSVNDFGIMSKFCWDDIIQLAHSSYTGRDLQSVIRIFDTVSEQVK